MTVGGVAAVFQVRVAVRLADFRPTIFGVTALVRTVAAVGADADFSLW